MAATKVESYLSKIAEILEKASPASLPSEFKENEALLAHVKEAYEVFSMYDDRLSLQENERNMLHDFMNRACLRANFDIDKILTSGEDNTFEIYSSDFTQIYRSFSFLKNFQTYDLTTIMTVSNFLLYDREEDVKPIILDTAVRTLQQGKLHKVEAPKHKVWEAYEADGIKKNTNYHWEMTPGYCGPLFQDDSKEPSAVFVSNHTVQVFKPLFLGDGVKPEHLSVVEG